MTKTAQLQCALAMMEGGHIKSAGPWATIAKPLLKGVGRAFQSGGMGAKAKMLGWRASSSGYGARALGNTPAAKQMGVNIGNLLHRQNAALAARSKLVGGLAGRELQGFNAANTAARLGGTGLATYQMLDYFRQMFRNNRLQGQVNQYENDFNQLYDAPVSNRLSYLFKPDPRRLYR